MSPPARRATCPLRDGEKYAVATDAAARRVAIATLDTDTVIQDVGGARRVVLKGAHERCRRTGLQPRREMARQRIGGRNRPHLVVARRLAVAGLRHGTGAVTDVAFSRDASHVATAAADWTVRVWPVAAGPPVLMHGHTGPVTSVGFDPHRPARRQHRAGRHRADLERHRRRDARRRCTPIAAPRRARRSAPTARRVVSAGDDGVLRITPCEVCGTFDEVLRLARSRAPRSLDAAARKRLLSTG